MALNPAPDLVQAGPCSEKNVGDPSLMYEFTLHTQWQCCHHRHFVEDSHNIIICTQKVWSSRQQSYLNYPTFT